MEFLSDLYRPKNRITKSITAENPTGEKGKGGMAQIPEFEKNTHPARDLGQGWKIRPFITLEPGSVSVLGDIKTSGIIKHIWMTHSYSTARPLIIRAYWDGNKQPSVECPLGDFCFNGWDGYNIHINSAAIAFNSGKGYNSFWQMPFKNSAYITIENRSEDNIALYYQIDYEEGQVPADSFYFHALFNRINPLPYKQDYVILEGIKGRGNYVGTYVGWQVNNNNWWGEGELKFYLDGDKEFPSICGTGTEDYFLGAYNFEIAGQYESYAGLYSGFYKVKNCGIYNCQTRFGMYRVHLTDPIIFNKDIRITMQSLGWKRDYRRFNHQQDDISSVAYFYLDELYKGKSILPDKEYCEIN